MKHIQTTSEAEKSMRGLYKVASDATPAIASEKHMASIRRIVEYTRQSDQLAAEISKEIGALMGYMQNHSSMVSPEGDVVITWKNGSDKVKVDYEGLIVACNIPPSTVQQFTTTTPGARVFKIEDENL